MGNKKITTTTTTLVKRNKQKHKALYHFSMIFTIVSEITCTVLIFGFFCNADVVIGGCASQATTIMGTHVSGPLLKNHTAILLHALTDVPLLSLNF